MSKKKKQRQHEAVNVEVHVHQPAETEVVEEPLKTQVPAPTRQITQIIPADPGWSAVLQKCPEHGIEDHEAHAVLFWAHVLYVNGGSNLAGLCLVRGKWSEASLDEHFMGYIKPGSSIADLTTELGIPSD